MEQADSPSPTAPLLETTTNQSHPIALTISKRRLMFVGFIIAFILSVSIGYLFSQSERDALVQAPPSLTPTVASGLPTSSTTHLKTPLNVKPINLTKDGFEQASPIIYQNTIAWLDLSSNDIWACKVGDIPHQPCISQVVVYDIPTNTTRTITSNLTWKEGLQLTDNYISWVERKSQNEFEQEQAYLYNLHTDEITKFSGGELIEADRVLISEADKRIYVQNLQTQEKTLLLENKGLGNYDEISNVKVSGDYLIWEEGYWVPGGEAGTTLYGAKLNNIQDKKTIVRLASKYFNVNRAPEIYHNMVVWEDFEVPNPDFKDQDKYNFVIYSYNIDTLEQSRMASKKSRNSFPKIWGGYILYRDSLEDTDVLINVNTKAAYKLTQGEDRFRNMRWSDINNGYAVGIGQPTLDISANDIYLLKLPEEI